jgi:RHS repeat-associated protein
MTFGSELQHFPMRDSIQSQLAGLGLVYDAAGNVIQDNFGTQYTYDGEGRLATAGAWTYSYDGDGNRVLKTAGGSTGNTYWYGPDGTLTDKQSVSLNPTYGWPGELERYFYLNGRLFLRAGFPYASYYVISDQLGSTRVSIDSRWDPTTNAYPPIYTDTYPFGGYVSASQPPPIDQSFTGKERDSESGNDYFGARYYASSMGRFLSPDWSAKIMPVPYAKLDNPQSLNLYSYVWNNPLSRNDPDGHVGKCDGGNTAQCASDLAKLAPGTKVGADGTVIKAGLLHRIWNHLDGNGEGTALVSSIVNTSTVVHISTDPGSRNGSTGGDASNVYIRYDPTGSTNQTRTGPGNSAIAPVDKPGQVTLGHELIHATHIANGTIDWTGFGVHSFSDPTGNYQERWRTEEFRTVGFQGFTQPGDITEQQLRHQFGLNDRATYTNPDNWTPQQ